jgi:hypothetical protein
MRKKKHTYKLGDILKIKFFDGSIHTGEVTKLEYMGDRVGMTNNQLPIYTVTSKNLPGNKRPYTNYTGMSDERVLEVNGAALEPLYEKLLKKKKVKKSIGTSIPKTKIAKKSDLDLAIEKQKSFLNGNI